MVRGENMVTMAAFFYPDWIHPVRDQITRTQWRIQGGG